MTNDKYGKNAVIPEGEGYQLALEKMPLDEVATGFLFGVNANVMTNKRGPEGEELDGIRFAVFTAEGITLRAAGFSADTLDPEFLNQNADAVKRVFLPIFKDPAITPGDDALRQQLVEAVASLNGQNAVEVMAAIRGARDSYYASLVQQQGGLPLVTEEEIQDTLSRQRDSMKTGQSGHGR